jgi:formate dehydrogenase subunit gamma
MSAPYMDDNEAPVRAEHVFQRFSLAQRWEHLVLLLSFGILLLTGLPQKYRTAPWSQYILSTPERVKAFQTVHHIAAAFLILLVLYHIGKGILLLVRRKLPGDIFPNWQDVKDAWKMVKYLLFLGKEKPVYGKYNFEQKVTYWFLFFGIGIMVVTGLILLFPIFVTRFLPGGIIPAALMAHSTEAIVALIFIVIWHFYHVHLERLNLSIFTGKLNEEEMKKYHALEYKRIMSQASKKKETGGKP